MAPVSAPRLPSTLSKKASSSGENDLLSKQGSITKCISQVRDQEKLILGSPDCLNITHANNLAKVRYILASTNNPLESMNTIASLQQMGIDYHYKGEIEKILRQIYQNFDAMHTDWNLSHVSLFFRLLRQGGYPVDPSVFDRFIDIDGRFNEYLSKDILGLLSLYEASQLNKGEDMLYKAIEFSSKHLKSSMCYSNHNMQGIIDHAIKHPFHVSLQRYKARHYLSQCKITHGINGLLQELARLDFNIIQSMHQNEVEEISCWWKNLGIARELKFARNQPIKWYLWPMSMLPHPQFSMHRIELAKVIAFVYLIDDIFDVYGSLEELSIFVAAIEKWELSAIDQLPTYMRLCYSSLLDITNEIARIVLSKTGTDPINSLKKMWATLCNAFLQESKWFSAEHVPSAEEYLRNGIISSGTNVVLGHLFFLLGQGIAKDNVELIESNPTLISNIATILRLWDDLGSAKDENQEGFDGSYVECYMKEHPNCSIQSAGEHVMKKISWAWENLNKECFSPSSFSPNFVEACLNSARMVKVMYSYDDSQHLPILEEYINSLLLKSL